MSSPSLPVLQQLHRLDRSSPDFQDQLRNVLYGEEYTRCVPELQDNDLIWLVDYLDKVIHPVAIPGSPLKPAQTLDGLDPSSATSRKCLRELRSRCGASATLPTSYTLSCHLFNIGSDPFAKGGYGDVYKGTLDGSSVCVKRIRVYTKDDPKKTAKVRFQSRSSRCSPSLTKLTGLLPRSRDVETVDTPKCFTPPGCHYRSSPTHFELDAWRRPAGIHQGKLRCRPTWSCRRPPLRCLSHAHSCYQLSDITKGLGYLHTCNVIHGDVKGVSGCS